MLAPVPGLLWLIHDHQRSPIADGIFWGIKGFIMPLFFLVSGFFSAQLFKKKTTWEFLRHRTKRILLPFIVSLVTILPLSLYVWMFGLVISGRVPVSKMLHPKFESYLPAEAVIDKQFWGLSHLWFLEYLYFYCVIFAVCVGMIRWCQIKIGSKITRQKEESETKSRFSFSVALPLLMILSALILWSDLQVIIGFHHGFLPFPTKLAYCGLFFVGGIFLFHEQTVLDKLCAMHAVLLGIAALLFSVALPLTHRQIASELFGTSRIVLAILLAVIAWTTVLGFVGFFLRIYPRPKPIIQYLAGASFWVYLIHHPLVGLFQIAVVDLPVSAEWKYSIVTIATISVSLLIYHWAVHQRWIGRLLNG